MIDFVEQDRIIKDIWNLIRDIHRSGDKDYILKQYNMFTVYAVDPKRYLVTIKPNEEIIQFTVYNDVGTRISLKVNGVLVSGSYLDNSKLVWNILKPYHRNFKLNTVGIK
jgi:hypothetical protein